MAQEGRRKHTLERDSEVSSDEERYFSSDSGFKTTCSTVDAKEDPVIGNCNFVNESLYKIASSFGIKRLFVAGTGGGASNGFMICLGNW